MAQFDWITSVLHDLATYADLNDLARLRRDIDVVRWNWDNDIVEAAARSKLGALTALLASANEGWGPDAPSTLEGSSSL